MLSVLVAGFELRDVSLSKHAWDSDVCHALCRCQKTTCELSLASAGCTSHVIKAALAARAVKFYLTTLPLSFLCSALVP